MSKPSLTIEGNLEDTEFAIARHADQSLLDRITQLTEALGLQCERTELQFVFTSGSSKLQGIPGHDIFKGMLDQDNYVFAQCDFYLSGGFMLKVKRPLAGRLVSGNTDTVYIKPGDGRRNDKTLEYAVAYARLCAAARHHFGAVDTKTYLDYVDAGAKALLQAKDQDLQKLQSTILQMTDQLASFTLQQEQKRVDFQAKLQKDYDDRKAEIERVHQGNTQKLEQEREALRKLRQEIDDRDNQTARRAIYEDIKKKIEARNKEFELTKGTQNRSWWPFCIAAALLLVFGTGYGYCLSLNANPPNGVTNLSLLASQISFAIAFLSTAIYLVRSTHQWFQKHAVEEFRLKRIDLDIDRANWLVELALEWSKISSGGQFPPELIDRLSRSLFLSEDAKDEGAHPADAFMTALGKVTRLEANVAGNHVTVEGADGKKSKADK